MKKKKKNAVLGTGVAGLQIFIFNYIEPIAKIHSTAVCCNSP